MWITYSILLLWLFSFRIVLAGSDCGDPVECCATDKPLQCVYKTPAQQAADPKCNCAPKDKFSTQDEQEECSWKAKPKGTTDYGKKTPCYGFYEECSPDDFRGSEPPPRCHISYPPSSVTMKFNSKNYCNFGPATTDIYNVFFTCWLYDCGNRLKKPENTTKSEGSKWCYPPSIRNMKTKFCNLYTIDNKVEYYDYEKDKTNFNFCVLPPFCKGATEKVDLDNYMPANVNNSGASNEKHCETLCDLNGDNIGTYKSGPIDKKCRVIPSCKPNTNLPDPAYNKFQVPTCLPWCTKEDSYIKSSAHTSRKKTYDTTGKKCNPLPICNATTGKAPEPPYGPLNPYAAIGKNCIPRRVCGDGENSAKHFCDPPTEASTEEPIRAGMSSTYIGIGIGGLALIILILVVAILVFRHFHKTEKVDQTIVSSTAEQNVVENKVIDEIGATQKTSKCSEDKSPMPSSTKAKKDPTKEDGKPEEEVDDGRDYKKEWEEAALPYAELKYRMKLRKEKREKEDEELKNLDKKIEAKLAKDGQNTTKNAKRSRETADNSGKKLKSSKETQNSSKRESSKENGSTKKK